MLDNSINTQQENPCLPPSSYLLCTVCKVAICQVVHVPTGSGEAWLSHQSSQALPHPLLTSLHPTPKCSALAGSLPNLSRHTQHSFWCVLLPSAPTAPSPWGTFFTLMTSSFLLWLILATSQKFRWFRRYFPAPMSLSYFKHFKSNSEGSIYVLLKNKRRDRLQFKLTTCQIPRMAGVYWEGGVKTTLCVVCLFTKTVKIRIE